ncbi:MAG: hypothetical protein JST64_14360, partial [Actinobacteria bacterium]|nr:hypothetical protein [Actinomycetota bacterium]
MTSPDPDGRSVAWIGSLLERTADAVSVALVEERARLGADASRWRERGQRPGQYRIDLVADAAALEVLRAGGVGILSEESGFEDLGNGLVVVVDPVDGSTNASRGLPWYAVSLCAVDERGPVVSLVVNLATGVRYSAVRAAGALRDGRPVRCSSVRRSAEAVVVLNG